MRAVARQQPFHDPEEEDAAAERRLQNPARGEGRVLAVSDEVQHEVDDCGCCEDRSPLFLAAKGSGRVRVGEARAVRRHVLILPWGVRMCGGGRSPRRGPASFPVSRSGGAGPVRPMLVRSSVRAGPSADSGASMGASRSGFVHAASCPGRETTNQRVQSWYGDRASRGPESFSCGNEAI